MTVKVFIPTALRQYADNTDTVELGGGTVGEVLSNLAEKFPTLKTHLFTDEGTLRNFVNVYVKDENIRSLNFNETVVAEGDEITLVPAVAGGTGILDKSTEGVELSNDEIERFSRHLILPEVGMDG
jgi:adenylyltransferase/sulfurtransferase